MNTKTQTLRPVAVVGGLRLPFCRQNTNYAELSSIDLMTAALRATVDKFQLKGEKLGEVVLGTTFYPPVTWNFARDVLMKSGLDPHTPAMFTQRACATSLDASIVLAQKIAMGKIEAGIAGGAESMSNVTLFYRPRLSRAVVRLAQAKAMGDRLKALTSIGPRDLKPGTPAAVEPTTGKSMGEHCEMMAKEWKVSRAEQDELALASHRNGVAAYERGFYKDLITPLQGAERDNNLRSDTSLEKMAKLKPAFDRSAAGTLTAGNSSPFTDGAATVVLASEEWAKAHRLPVLAYLTDYQSAAVDITKEGLLMAPAYAMPVMLDRNGLSLQSFDFYDIHEAFAAQVLCTLKAWESADFCRTRLNREAPLGAIDRKKLNVAGGSVALGHPFGATGARMVASVAKLLAEKGSGKGVLSICTGGGMGTVAILER